MFRPSFIAGLIGLMATVTFASPLASTQTVQRAVADFGLFGSWGDDCSLPMSPRNPRSFFTIAPDGTVVRRGLTGIEFDPANDFKILAARRIAKDQLAIHVESASEKLDIILQKRNGRVGALRSSAGGKLSIRNGIDLTTGRPNGSMKKCT